MPVRVWSVIDSGSRSSSSTIMRWFFFLLSSVASLRSWAMSDFSSGRPCRSRPATTTVRSEMLSSDEPMILRSRGQVGHPALELDDQLGRAARCRLSTVVRVVVEVVDDLADQLVAVGQGRW